MDVSKAREFVLSHHVAIAGAFTALVLLASTIQSLVWLNLGRDALIGRLVQVIFNSGALASAALAFLLVMLLPGPDWGKAKDFRPYVIVGALLTIVAASLQLLELFEALPVGSPAASQ